MTETHVYEQPLNEKVRAFLRLEKLFHQFAFHLKHGSDWNNRVAIDSILEILAFTTRSDIKLEVLKELERQHTRLERLSKRPQIDQSQLASVLKNIQKRIGELQAISGQVGQDTKNVELLTAIAQKSSVPGSICDFDLPALRHWLSLPKDTRQKHIDKWFRPFGPLDRAVQLILEVLRHSAEDTEEVAHNGFFQKSLDTNQAIQLLRISIPDNVICYPEISAGKHRFSVRFMKNEDPSIRPEQCQDDVSFKLKMCAI
ncbi:MAG: cell division protein ZapD [Gammaproteobacteria bacterium]|nr:cell division protein ZapD [Gammaproteobacteria bacterium]NNJ50621.1 cell division protein ZapD [Gammaproteobacteria bacterium]